MAISTDIYNVDDTVEGGERGRFRIVKAIASGGYGAIFRVRHCVKGGHSYALKVEKRNPSRDHYKLVMELKVLQTATKLNLQHFPALFDHCTQADRMWLVMSLLGDSLAGVQDKRKGGYLSLNTAYYCALETLKAIEELHQLGYVHRDIKPGNFVLGRRVDERINNNIYLVDFGISRYIFDQNGSILTPRAKTCFKGTPKYAPLSVHRGEEFARKDDVESWLYMFVDLASSNGLPWKNSRSLEEIGRMKRKVQENPAYIFEERKNLIDIMAYLQGLHYVDRMDYEWLRLKLTMAADEDKVAMKPPYDWRND